MDPSGAVKKALEVAETIDDPRLRAVAFGSLLSHFLGTEPSAPDQKGRPADARVRNGPKGRGGGSGGPKARVEALLEEGYFATPRTAQQILTALAERGHHMQHPDLTWPLQQMVKDRALRRQKQQIGNKQVWHYAQW